MKLTDDKNFASRILDGEKITLTFSFIDEESLTTINTIFLKILSRLGNVFLLETVITIIREIIFNAFKANLKRLYFTQKGIDITDKNQYDGMMENFKEDFLYNLDEVKPVIVDSNYFIKVSFELQENIIEFTVFNNVTLIDEEYSRIKNRIEQSKKYETLTDAYEDVYDPTEGAGLGLILMIFLLKNSGIGANNLKIKPEKNGVRVSISVPEVLREKKIVTEVTNRVIENVESLPTFPENIIELQRLCNSEESTLDQISLKIEHDPSITADVLKLSNSAGFVPGKKITTIKEALKIIGIKNLSLILTAAAAKKILSEKYKKFELIWDHCTRVAYYARVITKKKKLVNLLDSSFIAGMLHDIGKIILLSTDQKIVNTISEITKDKQLRSSSILEEISIGISHADLGGLIAEKWNFPDALKIAITNHHSPMNSPKEYKDITNAVYLANMLNGIETRKYNYFYIESDVLEWLGIEELKVIEEFHKSLKDEFNSHLSQLG